MKSRAAIAWEAGKPLSVEEIDVEGPKKGEALVRIVATGVCHTDAFTLSGADPEGFFPRILGHEGGGIVEEVGEGVTSIKPGDHVIPLYTAELGVAVVAPDTSPRGDDVADEDVFDMGKGAGFYVNATQAPWASHYQMYDYVVSELPALLADEFNTTLDLSREAIFGHSMGGHGALVIGLRNIDRFAAISAFSPICAPTEVPWGHKAFPKYLGDDRQAWLAYDATHLLSNADNAEALPPIRVEQGLADNFLDEQLHPHRLEEAAEQVGADVEVNRREGYDHSYFFIASFMEDHLRFLGRHLGV